MDPSISPHPALEELRRKHAEKFAPPEAIFAHVHRGDRIFIGTACGEPQHLVRSLIDYVASNPKAVFDAEILHVWTLGLAPYTDIKFKRNFRYNSFFVGDNTRDAVNQGLADYSPIFLSQVPRLFEERRVEIDVALIQVSPPDEHGWLSLGVSVDITKAAAQNARIVIAQVNRHMPRVHGDTFVHASEIDFLLPHDEPLLIYAATAPDEIAQAIGRYVARIVQDGDTIQVGYGSTPSAIVAGLKDRKHLGVHTELLSNGIVRLMQAGVIDNSRKSIDRGKAVASFCMGRPETYAFLDDNPAIEFRPISYTNDPLTIARIENMTAINAALQIDLTGQATAESIGPRFYSGIGGQADFMRGAVLAPGGKTILTLQSTARNEEVSRIVPFLDTGAGVTLGRGDIHYVVTEFGIAYLHGKNIRERAMALIAIAHPKFQPQLIQEAKQLGLIYKDQAFIPGKKGEYPEAFEARRTTRRGLSLLLRPVRITDESLLKDFFYSLSDKSVYRRFISQRRDMPHERLQEFTVIDYTREMVILVELVPEEGPSQTIAVGQYGIEEQAHVAEVALVVRDDYQGQGVGTELLGHLTHLAQAQGLLGFTAEVLVENVPMLRLFERMGFDIERRTAEGVCELRMRFRGRS
ncbi:MAG: GNAT family N-acetyltransferase [Candidatus Eisenbacteria bacterium]|uniref:GNAT family N-acetyltransferase n=1 Tax=Eiseniibacteriota bacterium TaxID=2212470 RepID=A0A938BNR6_UNCEI|nr:GNAT family N-acetyltransferase [Candidatus Eisenbacteria bacterium]